MHFQGTSTEPVQDIEDPNHLSLEEEKQRRSKEGKSRSIEEEKLYIQRSVASMKTRFRALQQR